MSGAVPGRWTEPLPETEREAFARTLVESPCNWRLLTGDEVERLAGTQYEFKKPHWMRLLFKIYDMEFIDSFRLKKRTWHDDDLVEGSMMLMYETVEDDPAVLHRD